MKKTISLMTIIGLLAMGSYMFFEPEIIKADYYETVVTLEVSSEITVSCNETCPMSGTINSISGGSATCNFTCTVTTPDVTGWNLTVQKDQLLLTGAGGENSQFSDYTENIPLDYNYATPDAGNETFGFNLRAATVAAMDKFTDNGSTTCGTGTVSNDHCWADIPTTPADKVSSSSSPAPTGADVNFGLKAAAGGSNALVPANDYTTTITATATVGE